MVNHYAESSLLDKTSIMNKKIIFGVSGFSILCLSIGLCLWQLELGKNPTDNENTTLSPNLTEEDTTLFPNPTEEDPKLFPNLAEEEFHEGNYYQATPKIHMNSRFPARRWISW